jgi:predicted nuclease of predicted toxin-antitoxin system
MKILLDECVTKRLKPHLSCFEVYTVNEMKWGGVKNGELMSLSVINQFDIILTIDKNMINQQNIKKYPITIVVFNASTSKIEELVLYIPSLLKQAKHFAKHKAYIIEKVAPVAN